MARPFEKLAESLKLLHQLQKRGITAIQAGDLTRVHRERLIKNGFLKEVMKGWFIPSRPDEPAGDSTAWYASFWEFCTSYLNNRFGEDWGLSPEQSLLLHAGDWTVPQQLLVRSSKGNNNRIQLLHNTSILDARYAMPARKEIEEKNGIRIFSLNPALITCSPKFFIQRSTELRALLLTMSDVSELIRFLLDGNHTQAAGRLTGAFRHIGKGDVANNIIKVMSAAGHDIRETDPFDDNISITFSSREKSPYVKRIQILWESMREYIVEHFPKPKESSTNIRSYLKSVEAIYLTDAYHSLSIEGYRVNEALIDKLRKGNWNPEFDEEDENHRNALAARGYWQAFQVVEHSIHKVLKKANAGDVVEKDSGNWYLELFGPSVTSGILKASDLAGYRSGPVYIRRSRHVPPNREAVRKLMPVFFELLREEKEASVRIVLGHFFFVYIHPYMDGNGRMGRFLMNVMCASGGYPWIVVPVEQRKRYMNALEKASTEQNIKPFCEFLAELV